MELSFDGWYDYWRLAVAIMCLVCLILLGHRWITNHEDWNTKTVDYWYALNMWCLAGLAIMIEAIFKDSSLNVRLIFITMASSVTIMGLIRRGSWGGPPK